ncbi:MAG: glycosyltransferase family 4 protein [Sulfuricella sp.]|nr:glycosyltransferase family 4 protein [Sulfuricella sp.]
MNVLMVSTSYPENAEDWRGRFIANLTTALARQQEVELSLWAPPGDLPPSVGNAASSNDAAWLKNLSQQGGIAHLLRTSKWLSASTVARLLLRLARVYRRQNPDLIHVNWLQNALPLWGTKTPAVVSVLGSDFALLRLPGMKTLLRAVFRQRRVILAPNAEWMRPTLESAFGDLAEIRPISFGVDDPWFKMQRALPNDGKHHWLTVTRLTRNKLGDLFAWGEGLFGQDRLLHLFGPMQEEMTLPSWIVYHGPTHPAELLANWFPQAAGLITLSSHDEGRPQVMLEAMAAGLPVIASNLPAHRDIIRHRQTGWLVNSADEFRESLAILEIPSHNQETGKAARIWIKANIGTWDDCAGRYVSAYHRLLERKS